MDVPNNEEHRRRMIQFVYKNKLRVKIYQSEGDQFEDFFTEVMKKINPAHRNPKSRGKLGDGKCDGFLQNTGEYFQCYSPEDIRERTTTARKKAEKTVKKIIDEWNSIAEVKKIFFVVNDKFKDVDQEVYNKISQLNETYKPVQIKEFLMSDFERMFFEKLSFEQIEELFGYIPNDQQLLNSIEGNLVLEIIRDLLELVEEDIPDKTISAPPIDDKIVYNELNQEIKKFLDRGYVETYFLEDYFRKNKNDEIALKSLFIKTYEEACVNCSDNNEKFFYIVEKLCNDKRRVFRNEFFMIVSYYFSFCDIFEEPPVQAQEIIK